MLYKVSEITGARWMQQGIATVPVGGKNNLDRPAVVFRGLHIPIFVLFDGDVSHRGQPEERSSAQKNIQVLRLVGGPVETEFHGTTVEQTWACFEDRIEAYLEVELGDDFRTHRDAVATELGYVKAADALKNFDGAALFVERVYGAGRRLPLLEEIVARISALA